MANDPRATAPSAHPAGSGAHIAGTSGPVPAGSPEIPGILAALLAQIGMEREIAVAISNYTSTGLEHPAYYLDPGKLTLVPAGISAGQAGFVTASRTSGAKVGTGGVLGYRIQGTSSRLVILWSVPEDYGKKTNRFGFQVVADSVPVDSNLYERMYGASQEAAAGPLEVTQDGYDIEGTMDTGGQATLNVSFRTSS